MAKVNVRVVSNISKSKTFQLQIIKIQDYEKIQHYFLSDNCWLTTI
jgi:hypothetical protein